MNLLRSILPFAPRRAYREYATRWKDRLRGETIETYFDLHNPEELDPVLEACGVEPLRCDPAEVTNESGAIRFILGLLTYKTRLRSRFPTALTDGPDGPFARWIADTGSTLLGLSKPALSEIAAAFAKYPGEKGKRVFEIRRDIRTAFPFGLTPYGREPFLGWLLIHGTRDLGFTAEEALWFHFEMNEAPDRGLAATYLVRPDWQEKLPHALTIFGWGKFKEYLQTEYGLCGRWFDRATLPACFTPSEQLQLLQQAVPDMHSRGNAVSKLPRSWKKQWKEEICTGTASRPGVNVLGHFRYPSGLQEAATGLVSALDRTGVRTQARDLPVLFPSDWTDRKRYRGVELFDTSIWVTAVNTFPDVYFPYTGLHRRNGVYRIAYWYWELEDVPADWVPKLGWADEVWAPTRFVAEAFRKVVNVPVVEMLPGVELSPFEPLPKSYFGMREDRFTFLFTFDMHSTAARKNPLGVIEAFRRAFRPGEPVELVIKVSRGKSDPQNLATLQSAAEEVGAKIFDRVMPRNEVLGLMNAADCYVSLHRSEGLGLGLIESMLMGKPVIATAYSGNVDFMNAMNSFPVQAGRVAVPELAHVYPKGCVWGDPDLDHAAEQMRRVYEDAAKARDVGLRAKMDMEQILSANAYGKRAAKRLAEISNSRTNSPVGISRE